MNIENFLDHIFARILASLFIIFILKSFGLSSAPLVMIGIMMVGVGLLTKSWAAGFFAGMTFSWHILDEVANRSLNMNIATLSLFALIGVGLYLLPIMQQKYHAIPVFITSFFCSLGIWFLNAIIMAESTGSSFGSGLFQGI